MDLPIEWLPAEGRAEQLILLLHGSGAGGAQMAPLAQVLRAEFPQAALVAPDAPAPHVAPPDAPAAAVGARQWFDARGLTEDNRAERTADAVARLLPWVRGEQRRLGVGPAATALAGFGEGATLALELALAADGLAGRVLAFGGRFVELPQHAPEQTTLHFFHGGADAVVPVAHTQMALEALQILRGDATMDIAQGIGHELHPALLQRAIFRLRNHIPARTWAAALGSVPVPRTRHADGRPLDD